MNELLHPKDLENSIDRFEVQVGALSHMPPRKDGDDPYMEHRMLAGQVQRMAGNVLDYYGSDALRLADDIQKDPSVAKYVQYAGTERTIRGLNALTHEGYCNARMEALAAFLGVLIACKSGDPYIMQLRMGAGARPITNEVSGIVQRQPLALVENVRNRGLGISTPLVRNRGGMHEDGVIPFSYMAVRDTDKLYTLRLITEEDAINQELNERFVAALAHDELEYESLSALRLAEGAQRKLTDFLHESEAAEVVQAVVRQYADRQAPEDLPERMHWLRREYPGILHESEELVRATAPDAFDISPEANDIRYHGRLKLDMLTAIRRATIETSFDTIRKHAQRLRYES